MLLTICRNPMPTKTLVHPRRGALLPRPLTRMPRGPQKRPSPPKLPAPRLSPPNPVPRNGIPPNTLHQTRPRLPLHLVPPVLPATSGPSLPATPQTLTSSPLSRSTSLPSAFKKSANSTLRLQRLIFSLPLTWMNRGVQSSGVRMARLRE